MLTWVLTRQNPWNPKNPWFRVRPASRARASFAISFQKCRSQVIGAHLVMARYLDRLGTVPIVLHEQHASLRKSGSNRLSVIASAQLFSPRRGRHIVIPAFALLLAVARDLACRYGIIERDFPRRNEAGDPMSEKEGPDLLDAFAQFRGFGAAA